MEEAPDGSLFMDVGAHIGLYSALVSAIFQSRGIHAIAFEPTPETASTARRISRSNEASFEVVECAVSDRPGTATLFLSAKAETSNSLNSDFREHAGDVEVDVTSIDHFVQDRGVAPRVIKIDVETHERAVLEGALGTIAQARPWLVVEVLDRGNDNPLWETLDRIQGIGYHLYPIVPELTWTPSHPRLGTRAGEGYRDWLLAPSTVSAVFAERVQRWRAAIGACTAETSAVVPQGCTFAPGWNHRETWTIS